MLKHGLEGINLNNPIENKLPQIIEYFVKFYGEKYRDKITQRINDAVIIFIDKSSTNRNADINAYFNSLRGQLMQNFREKIKENTGISFFENSSLGYFSSAQLNKISSWKNKIEEKDIENVTNFLKHFDRNLNTEIIKNALNSENSSKIYAFLTKLDEIYLNYIKNDLFYIENEREKYLDNATKIKGLYQLENMYFEETKNILFQNLILNFNLPISKESRAKFEEFSLVYLDFINKDRNFFIQYDIDKLQPFFKYLDSFSTSHKKHNSFYDFLNDKDFMEKLVPESLKENIDEIERQKQKELSPILSGKSENLSKIYSGEFLQEDIILSHINSFINFASANKTAAFVLPAPSYSNKKQTSICVLGTFFQLFDSHLVHEFNHIIEMDYRLENGVIKNKCGFDYENISIASGNKTSISNCELLNEVVNDYLSRKVLSLMQNDGFLVGHESDSGSSYTKAFPLLSQLIEDNLDDIIEARMSDRSMQFAEKIGMENFTILANSTSTLFEILKQFPFYYAEANIKNILNIEGKVDFFSIKPNKNFSNNTNDILKCFNDVKTVMDRIKQKNSKKTLENDEKIEINN